MHVTNSINFFIGMSSGEVSYLVDSVTTHTILHERHYFTNFIPKKAPLTTLSGSTNLIEGYGKARIMLSNGTILTIKEALYSPRSGRTLLSFRDIRDNQYHLETTEDYVLNFFVSLHTNMARSIFTRSWNVCRVGCTSQPFAA